MPITDPYSDQAEGLDSPISGGFAITPNDAADLSVMPRAILLAGGGDLALTFKDGSNVTLSGLAPGVIYPLRVRRILATGTTATGLVGLV